jgi:hypothetical protein
MAYLAGLQLVNDGDISESWNILMTVFTLPTPLFPRTVAGSYRISGLFFRLITSGYQVPVL